MRARYLVLTLTVGLCSLAKLADASAQQGSGSRELSNPASPIPQQIEQSPNTNPSAAATAEPLSLPGFSEATDQSTNPLASPTPTPQGLIQNNQTSPVNRRPTPIPASRNSNRNNNSFSPRLARASPIMGDSFAPTLQYFNQDDSAGAQFPGGGGATRAKIAENTAAFPVDRFIFNYNHFHNAVESFGESTHADRFTIGIEKTFLNNLFSIDVRFPLTADNDIENGFLTRNGSEVGNLSINLKALLTSDDDSAIVAGMTIDTPTGGDLTASLFGDTFIRLNNDAAHLAPFLGFLCLQSDSIAHQGFLQVDVPLNPNSVVFSDTSTAPITADFLEQTLLYVDYSLSFALFDAGRSRDAIQRVSGIAEMHYTTTLEDSDELVFSSPLNNNFNLTSTGNRIDVVNLTFGVDTVFDCGANVRFGTVVPITDGDDRFFDVEFQAQLNMPL